MAQDRSAQQEPSSRLCVKNVPKYVTSQRVKEFFSAKGCEVTDVKVLKTAAGVPRQVAFVGFKTVEDASKTLKYFNKSFFDTCRLSIDFALPFGDSRLNKNSSKRGRDSDDHDADGQDGDLKKKKRKNPKEDKKLSEFLKLMQPRRQQQFWADEEHDQTAAAEEEDDDSSSEDEDKNLSATKDEGSGKDTDNLDGEPKPPPTSLAAESGRLFLRNLCFDATEDDLDAAFSRFGPIAETHIPKDESGRSRGFGYVTFMIPEHAVVAISKMDMQIFQGRLLHVMPALEKEEPNGGVEGDGRDGSGVKAQSSFKAKKEAERKEQANDTRSWNALFVRGDAAVGAVAEQLGMGKGDLLLGDGEQDKTSAAVRMALSETRVIAETKKFLAEEGVDVDLLEQGVRDPSSVKRSKDTFLVKNLPAETDKAQVRQLFAKYGDVVKFVLPPSKTMALVQFFEPKNAKRAFKGMAYKRYKRVPIYLEWAPANVLSDEELVRRRAVAAEADAAIKAKEVAAAAAKAKEDEEDAEADSHTVKPAVQADGEVEVSHTLFVKNLNFETREAGLHKFFERIVGKGNVAHVSIPRKSGREELSMGFGFVEFKDDKSCRKALRKARGEKLDNHELEISISKRTVDTNAATPAGGSRKTSSKPSLVHADAKEAEEATKIIIRNLAFEANRKELRQLVSAYGQVNTIRIPKKPDGSHRGFAFVDFVTHQEARTAFAALTNTHFYGRHLVLEWAQDNSSMEAMREKAAKAIQG